jgi:hypothetical protein
MGGGGGRREERKLINIRTTYTFFSERKCPLTQPRFNFFNTNYTIYWTSYCSASYHSGSSQLVVGENNDMGSPVVFSDSVSESHLKGLGFKSMRWRVIIVVYYNETGGRVVMNLDSYPGHPGFETQPRNRQFWLWFQVVLLSASWQMLGYCLKVVLACHICNV